MNASANYTLMTDADGEGTGASSITARNSIALQGIQPAETNPVVHSDSNGGDSSCEDSPDAVMRSPKRSILKRAQRTPTENSENNSRSRISSNRVLFCDKSPVGIPDSGSAQIQSEGSDERSVYFDSSSNATASVPRRRPPPLTRLKSQLNFDELGRNEVELKANLYYHIGNPIKRWRIEKVAPLKLILQLIKTVCLVIQVFLFTSTIANQRADFFYNTREVFENLFFKDFEGNPRGLYTAFSIQELFERFDYICENYYKLPLITIGGYDFQLQDGKPVPVQFKLRQYSSVHLNASTFHYDLDGQLKTTLYTVSEEENATEQYITFSNDSLFNRFFDMVVSFPIHNVRIAERNRAECFTFDIKITFQSRYDSGKILYFLREGHREAKCEGTIVNGSISLDLKNGLLTCLDIFIILLSIFSIFLICTTLKRAIKLAKAMGLFYSEKLQIDLSWWERRPLFPAWHFLNFISDMIIILGTAYKIGLDYYVVSLSSPTRILLGIAVVLQAGVVLRYVAYFQKFNALNRTLYLAFPELLKFLICAGLLFLAFSLTGFIILSPFHQKFVTFYETIETLFCLLNGDDMYATFDQLDVDDDLVAYVFSRIFLYVFLVLFIYFVLNLFTSLVISAYESSQNIDSGMKNEVRRFVFSGPLTPNGVALRDVTLTKKYVDPQVILRRKEKRKNNARLRRYSIRDALNAAA